MSLSWLDIFASKPRKVKEDGKTEGQIFHSFPIKCGTRDRQHGLVFAMNSGTKMKMTIYCFLLVHNSLGEDKDDNTLVPSSSCECLGKDEIVKTCILISFKQLDIMKECYDIQFTSPTK